MIPKSLLNHCSVEKRCLDSMDAFGFIGEIFQASFDCGTRNLQRMVLTCLVRVHHRCEDGTFVGKGDLRVLQRFPQGKSACSIGCDPEVEHGVFYLRVRNLGGFDPGERKFSPSPKESGSFSIRSRLFSIW